MNRYLLVTILIIFQIKITQCQTNLVFTTPSTEELVTLISPVYARHLTSKDLDEIITFYQTPAGRKLSSSQGAITAESMILGQDWGAISGEKVLKKLEEKGY